MAENSLSFNEFEGEMHSLTRQSLKELDSLWSEMGVQKQERMNTVIQYINEAFSTLISEERKHLDQILKEIQVLEKETQLLLKELGKDRENTDQYDELTYVEIFRNLKTLRDELKEQKEKQMIAVKAIRKVDEDASAELDMPPYALPAESLPTTQQISELQMHILEMADLKHTRSQKFKSAKDQILKLYAELGTEPSTTVERRLICSQTTEIALSSTHLNTIEKMLTTLQDQLDSNKSKMRRMLERMHLLCSRLNINEENKAKYVTNEHFGFSEGAIKEVSSKLEELEAMKLASLSQFIGEARKEISEYWDRCKYGMVQRNDFAPMYSKNFTEKLLDDHETEANRLKIYWEENANLYAKVEEWEQLWNKKVVLDSKEKDPNRLFNRRKNNLAQEEAERKRIKKLLPKTEMEICEMVKAHDKDGHLFTINGYPLAEYFEVKKAGYGEEAELQKLQKKDMRKKIAEHETIYGTTRNPLTPMNMTTTLAKSRRLEPPIKGTPRKCPSAEADRYASATKKALMIKPTIGPQSSQKTPISNKRMGGWGKNIVTSAKKMKMTDNSIISGNLQNTISSVDSCTSYKAQEFVSSTFSSDSGYEPGRRMLRPTKPANGLTSTPVKSNLKTRDAAIFKTPSSTGRFNSGKRNATKNNGTLLKDGRKIPFKI